MNVKKIGKATALELLNFKSPPIRAFWITSIVLSISFFAGIALISFAIKFSNTSEQATALEMKNSNAPDLALAPK